ncbi:uncharacterized protein LOC144098486 [Amblyomma americanum]
MPVLANYSLPLSTGPYFRKSPMASPCEEDIRAAAASAATAEADIALEAPLVVNGSEASQSHHSVRVESASSSSAPMTPEKATKNRSLSDGRLARAAEPTCRKPWCVGWRTRSMNGFATWTPTYDTCTFS